MENYTYQIGGSLAMDAPSYIERQADTELYEALLAGKFCYILNSRQMGKSSLLVRTRHHLQQAGFKCTNVDMTNIGSENITPLQWYKGIVTDLWLGFNLKEKINLKTWWKDAEEVSLLQRLSQFIHELLVQFPQERLFIFIDEIDSIISLDFPVDDFFALIRYCYNQRAINPEYKRITFAIFGVATPSDLINDRNRTPFNIGKAIELQGFELAAAMGLAKGLQLKEGNPETVLAEILAWTNGQPFLTQKLCQLVVSFSQASVSGGLRIPQGTEKFWVESIVRSHIIHQWESQDEPEHLKTIRDRILRNERRAGRLLGIYQQILQGVQVFSDDSNEQIELLLSGLVVKNQGLLKVKNRIYQDIFNLEWVEKQLTSLRPYSQALDAWLASQQTDTSRLLRGQALKDAQTWAQDKSLSDKDYQFLATSEGLDRKEVQLVLESERAKEIEARLLQEKKTARQQRFFLVAVSMSLLIAVGLGIATYIQYRRAAVSAKLARISELQAIATSSKALFNSGQKLEALVLAIKAQQGLRQFPNVNIQLKNAINFTLKKAVYGAIESNRLSGFKKGVNHVAYSPDGKFIATASIDGAVTLWKQDGTRVKTFLGHTDRAWSVAFSPDSSLLASSSADGTIKLWKVADTCKDNICNVSTIRAHKWGVWRVIFSPDGKMLASVSYDKTIKLWKRDGTLIKTFKESDAVLGIAFSPDGKTLASGGSDRQIKIRKLEGTIIATLSDGQTSFYGLIYSPDGSLIASANDDGTIKLWQTNGKLLTTLAGHSLLCYDIAFSPDGKTLASVGQDGTLKLWHKDGTLLTTLEGHESELRGVAFSPDGQTIATASLDRSVRLWKPKGIHFLTVLGQGREPRSLAINPKGKTIASGNRNGTINLWDYHGNLLKTIVADPIRARGLAFSPDGNTLAAGSKGNTIKLWSLEGNLLKTLTANQGRISRLVFSPDGKTIASTGFDGTLKLWNREGTLIKTIPICELIVGFAFSPNGEMMALGCGDGNQIKLLDREGSLLATMKGHTATVWSVAFSKDSQILASSAADSTAKLWKLDGTLLKTLTGHNSLVWEVAFSSDDQLVATASSDRTVKLWHASDGSLITTLNGHQSSVEHVAFSPDGKTLISASNDQTIILWDLKTVVQNDSVLKYGCNWVRDYLRTNAQVDEKDRHLCDANK